MNSFVLKIDPRSAQYGRFASSLLRTLREAVGYRTNQGHRQVEIADRLGWHPSQLSRVLNGRVNNISAKTISDILWACDFEPEEFGAGPVEKICHNHLSYFSGISATGADGRGNNVIVLPQAVHGTRNGPSATTLIQ